MHSNLFPEGGKTKSCANQKKIVGFFFFKTFVEIISFLGTSDHGWALNKGLVVPG